MANKGSTKSAIFLMSVFSVYLSLYNPDTVYDSCCGSISVRETPQHNSCSFSGSGFQTFAMHVGNQPSPSNERPVQHTVTA